VKKLLIAVAACLLFASTSALAVTGPEAPHTNPGADPLKMDFNKDRGPARTVFSRISFPQRPYGEDGWDFGGRPGYGCAFMEVVDGGPTASLSDDVVIARVVGERYENIFENPELYLVMDTPNNGAGNDAPCSNGYTDPNPIGRASAEELSRSFGGPGEPSFAHGHIIQVWQDGVEVGRIQTPHDEIEFRPDGQPGRGETAWWFKGDEDGEIILWYENPSLTPAPYGIIGRLSVVSYFPNVTFDDCVIGNPQGTPCPQAYPNEPAPPPSDATGSSSVSLSDGRTATVNLTVPGFLPPAPATSCGTATVTLGDGRNVVTEVCA
jgi:hypothetical protein